MGVIEVDDSKRGGSPQESRTRDSYVPWILLYYCDTTVNPHLEYELLAFDVSELQGTCTRRDPLRLTGAKTGSARRAQQSLIYDSWLGFLLTFLLFLTILLTSLSRHTEHFLTTHLTLSHHISDLRISRLFYRQTQLPTQLDPSNDVRLPS